MLTNSLWTIANRFSKNILLPAHRLTDRKLLYAKKWDAVRQAEQHNHKLNNAMRRRCRDYAVEVLGSANYTAEMAIFCAVHGQWRDHMLPESYYFSVVAKNILGRFFDVSGAKTKTQFFLRSDILTDIGFMFGGRLYSRNMEWIEPNRAAEFLFAGCDRIVFKKDGGGYGIGIHVLGATEFDPALLGKLGNGVLQPFIEQHPELTLPGVEAVTTMRIVTTLGPDGDPTLNFAFLRLGFSKNRFIVPSDSIRVSLDASTGTWSDTGYLANWMPLAAHPENNMMFAGRKVPMFAQATQQCIALHRQVPFLPSVGWDVSVNRNEQVQLMEWNVPHGISYAETVDGPNFAGRGWESLWRTAA